MDFLVQLETGTETSIPHYQLAIKTNSLCTKKKVLEALEEKIECHINVQIQFNLDDTKELKFLTPTNLAIFLKNFKGIAQNSNVDKSRIRRFVFESFKGQLEKGLKSNRPHYNLCVKTSSKILSSTVVRELSLALYNVKNCYSINIEPAHDIKSLEKYCLKDETILILPGTIYYPPSVDIRITEFFEALGEDEELKKYMNSLVYISR